MRVETFAPAADLAAFVASFQIVESARELERTLLPDPYVIVGVRYAGASYLVDNTTVQRVPDLAITGLRTSPRRMRTAAASGIVVIRLHPTGAVALLGAPMQRLFGQVVPLATELVDPAALACAATDRARIAIVEAALRARLPGTWAADRLVAAAVAELHATGGLVRIHDLAARLGASQDALEKRFRRIVGASPKQFATIVQLRAAFAGRAAAASLGDLAVHAGFYDQAHFNRRFRAMAGGSPTELLGADEVC